MQSWHLIYCFLLLETYLIHLFFQFLDMNFTLLFCVLEHNFYHFYGGFMGVHEKVVLVSGMKTSYFSVICKMFLVSDMSLV